MSLFDFYQSDVLVYRDLDSPLIRLDAYYITEFVNQVDDVYYFVYGWKYEVDEDQRGMLFGGGLIIKSPVKFIQYLDFKAFIKFYLDIIETYSCNTTDEYLRSIDEILLMFLCFTHALKQPFVFNAPITLVYNSCWERYTVSRGQSVISSPYYEQS